ncbi:MAG: S9 family peptidase [Thermoanaerobaculia bacterium]
MKLGLAALSLLVAGTLFAQQRLTIDTIYDPANANAFGATPPTRFDWIDDDHFLWPQRNGAGEVVADVLVDARTGSEVAMFDGADLEAQARKIEGVSGEDAKKLARPASPELDPKHNAMLLTIGGDLYIYSIAGKTLTRLTRQAGAGEQASFSPDGRLVSFVRGNDLLVADAAGKGERNLTSGGSARLFHGKLDWVYQEEIYGRGDFRGYWWSPDSKWIAYLQLDATAVKPYTVVDHIPYAQTLEVSDYPLAGDPNPVASLFVVDVATGDRKEIDLAGYRAADPLIVAVSWTPDSRFVVAQIQDREQTWLDLVKASPSDGAVKKILRETTEAWVQASPDPEWLKDGSFLWLSERSGFKHLYRVSADGAKQTQITKGSWEVTTLHGVDPSRGLVYFSATERSAIGSDVYRMRLDGSRMQRITTAAGTHTASFNPSLSRFLDTRSDINTPPRTEIVSVETKNPPIPLAGDAPAATLVSGLGLVRPELVQVKTRDGFPMEAMIIRPRDYDPSKRYPVFEFTYSGPHAPQVKNAWGGTAYLFHQMLAQNGVVVWICDNRSASGKGIAPTWQIYKNFGALELRDLEDGVAWLKQQPGIDALRFILAGSSFGGFMTSYALTHSTAWKAGIAGAPVTDWRDYDSVYTERYMLTPQHNKEGYERTAPRWSGANLHGNLLLIHGSTDDNVHLQNTIQFAYELEKAGKPFRMMLYPKSRHGVKDPPLEKHMRQMMFDYVMEMVRQ